MNNDIYLAKTANRKEWYRLQAEHYIKEIPAMQASDGAFRIGVEPVYGPGKNARLQEGILPLAWHMDRFGTQNFRENIIAGIRYLLKMQAANGSYPEIDGGSFAATAFSTYALAKTLEYSGSFLPDEIKNNVMQALKRAVPYLTDKTDIPYTNQLAAALLAIKQSGETMPVPGNILHDKLAAILSSRDSSGLFKEGDGIDLGYSTLTYSLLSTFDSSSDHYKEFTGTIGRLIFPDGTHILPMSRTYGWIILNSLEAANRFYRTAGELAQRHIEAHEAGLCNATHIISKRHVLTTIYRLCEAYDSCDLNVSLAGRDKIRDEAPPSSKYLRYFVNGKITALFYTGKDMLGYSLYLGPKRILFGSMKRAVLKENGQKIEILKTCMKNIIHIPVRSFIFIAGGVRLSGGYTPEPVFSIGRIMENAGEAHDLKGAGQNMFYKEDIFMNRLSPFGKYDLRFLER